MNRSVRLLLAVLLSSQALAQSPINFTADTSASRRHPTRYQLAFPGGQPVAIPPVGGGAVFGLLTPTQLVQALLSKQNTLVSGVSLKTFGGQSLLGSGDIPLPSSTGGGSATFFVDPTIKGDFTQTSPGGVDTDAEKTRVVALVMSTLRGIDGFDANATNQVLSHVGLAYKWITASTSTTATSSTTASGPLSARDSVLYNADSTKMRFAVTGTTSTTLSTVAQLRAFLTSTQTNVRAFLADGIYDDGQAFEQNGTWTNVSLEAINFRKAILQNSGTSNGNLVFIHQGGNSRRQVRFKDFVIRTSATGSAENTNLPMYLHNELPDWNGLEWDGLEIYNMTPSTAKTNGFTFALYSEGKTGVQDKVLRNVFFHNCYIHDIPRANEFLNHGFDLVRGLNFVITNNKFIRHGTNDAYGVPISYSGPLQYIYTAKNIMTEFQRMAIEHVCNQYAITASNVISNTATTGGVGLAISDNGHNLTSNIWFENNSVNVMDRPFYAYDVKKLTISGGSYTGRLGADGTPINSVFKDFPLTVWAKAGQTVYNYVWQFDGASSGNTITNVTASSGATQANSPGGPTAYTIHLTGGTSNNTFTNNTTILGKDPNGNWAGGGGIVNDGAASNSITNTTTTRVD